MNVGVKHNGSFITDEVVSYEREHKICTGIGRLVVIVSNSSGITFNPWDNIDIYEDGDFKVRYYISSVERSNPRNEIVLECQDNSKRLIDYFIPDQYTVEVPTFTRYWIEKFLDEVGIDYVFDSVGQGNLLSNYTSLGLTQAYEQIMTLLQLSGWYMYFDGNGVAIIGKLNKELSPVDDTYNRTDVLEIAIKKDDRMLRNRALVWGNVDTFTMQRVFADVQVKTKWNYDSHDVRTMVVANSNIPNNSSAYSIANMLVKEFSRITIEKHLSVHGARDINLGDIVRVNTTVYTGKALVTTFGTSMSKDGLITNLILDERCPRLFGFFNFGDYVYVGTYGDGIWRKHIRFEHSWHDFSAGLEDTRVTDLHISNGVFSSVTADGGMYYTLTDDGPWIHISTPESLTSFLEDDIVPSGTTLEVIPYSGIKARATIVDKDFNRILYGVDTYSGENLGDYFMTLSGWTTTISGILSPMASGVTISGYRGWILDYQPNNGINNYAAYPIHVSGEYNIRVVDIENDGDKDYVSVAIVEPGPIARTSIGYNFGYQTYQAITEVGDTNSLVSIAVEEFNLEGQTKAGTLTTANTKTVSVFDNESIGESDIVWYESGGGLARFIRKQFYKEFNETLGRDEVLTLDTTSPSQVGSGLGIVECITKVSLGVYNIIHSAATGGTLDTDYTYTVKLRVWDSLLNTVTGDTTLGTITVAEDPDKPMSSNSEFFQTDTKVINNILYHYILHFGSTNGGTGAAPNDENYVTISRMTVDTLTGSTVSGHLETIDFEQSEGFPGLTWVAFSLTGSLPLPQFLFQKGDGVAISFVMREWDNLSSGSATLLRNWLVSSEDGITFEKTQIQTATTDTDPDFLTSSGATESTSGGSQLTSNNHLLYHRQSSTGNTYIFNGETVVITNYPSDVPYYWKHSQIYPLFGVYSDKYLVKDSGDWYFANSNSLIVTTNITFPSNYTINAPYLTTDSITPQYYWLATNSNTGKQEILITSNASLIRTIVPFEVPGASFLDRGYIAGNFFINHKLGTGAVRYIYLNNDSGVPGGGTRFLVLQREENDFNIVQEASYPIRIDISNYSPLLTLQTVEATFNSFFIYDNEVVQTIMPSTASGVLTEVRDYRYTFLPGSGLLGLSKQALYVYDSNIHSFDIETMSGVGLIYETAIDSGAGGLNCIETSNYAQSGQYVFVTTSGENPQFYQKDPSPDTFIYYSGLPAARATIIRLDDRI